MKKNFLRYPKPLTILINSMKVESKKQIVFGMIISFLTSAYAAFLKTTLQQGFYTDHFLVNWIKQIPQIYLFILPFVLIVAPFVKALVDRLFRNEKQPNN
jgi:Protein of unknown function (DUF2798)